jgi:LacI family gluconate utilization system Gnt-I transcriptional repressor
MSKARTAAPAVAAEAPRPAPRRRVRRGSGRATLADVARLADVSTQTVSRVINMPDKVPPETVAHVRNAIERAGYVPNLLAGGLASGRSKLVAALVPTIGGQVFNETIGALAKALKLNGYQLMLGESGYEDADEEALLDNIIRRRPDGIVLTRIVKSAAARERLRKSRIPVVETWDLTDDPVDMLLGFSHVDIGATVAKYFHSHGRRQLGLIIGDDPRAGLRGRGYVEAVAQLGLLSDDYPEVPLVRVSAPASLGSGRTGIATLMQRCPGLDAVFCSTDMVALGVLIEARKLGLRIPHDLAVIGFGDLWFAHEADPALTTVRVDGTLMGNRAAQLIISRAEGWPIDRAVVDIGFNLVRRESA